MVERPAPPAGLSLDGLAGEIHLFRLDLAEASEESWALLDAAERSRAGRIRHGQARRCFVQARAGLRHLLGHYLGCDPTAIGFALGAKGKPRLADTAPDRGLVFNVSHSGELGLIALALDTALGVDVERTRPMANRQAMAERCFAPSELAWWNSLPEEQRQAAFFRLWCAKEAFVKATGEGIGLGLQSCVADLSGPPRLLAVPQGHGPAAEWRLAEIEAGPSHGAALCYRGPERRLRLGPAPIL